MEAKMTDCIFCKIIAREIACNKVYEDNHTFAFLDIHPIARGHTLVIPKKHATHIENLSKETFGEYMGGVHTVATAMMKQWKGVNLLQRNGEVAGQEVMHVHFHIIPREKGDNVNLTKWDGTYRDVDKDALITVQKEIQALF